MISVSTLYDNIISASGHYEWQIVNGTKTIDNDLKSGTISQTLFKQASIGNVLSAELKFEYYDDGTPLDTSEPLVVSLRAVSGSSQSEWITKGTYYIDTIEQSPYSTVVRVTAFDALLKANVTWMRTGTFTATTDLAIVQGIASDIGVSINSDTSALFASPVTITQAPNIGENGTTSMEMLSYIGVMHCGNWIIDSNNELKLIPLFSETDIANVGDAVTDFDASPAEEIVGVCIWGGPNNYFRVPDVDDAQWTALDGRIIDANCYIGASQELAQSLYNTLHGETYYPYTAEKVWMDLKYELGDGVTIKDVTSVICDQTINLTALGSSSLNAKGRDIVTSHYPTPTPTERKLAQTEQTVASIQIQTDGIQSTVTELNGNVTTMQTQVTQNASGLEVLTQEMEDQSNYIRWDGSAGTVSIGGSGSSTEAQITPDGFAVVEHGEKILSAEGQKVVAKHLETETLSVGRYQWVDENYLGFSLIYTGA